MQNWSIHAKYVFLHCSYSAPVRVSDTALARFVAAREIILDDDARTGVFVVAVLALVGGVAARALRSDTTLVLVAVREDNARCVRATDVRRGVVAVRTWGCFALFVLREIVVPSRTAALGVPMQQIKPIMKTRNFFISGKIIANL